MHGPVVLRSKQMPPESEIYRPEVTVPGADSRANITASDVGLYTLSVLPRTDAAYTNGLLLTY